MIAMLQTILSWSLVTKLLVGSLSILLSAWAYTKLSGTQLPPGPKSLPFIGLLKFCNHLDLYHHKDVYGDLSHFKYFGKNIFVLNSIQTIKAVLFGKESSEHFINRSDSYFQRNIGNSSIIFENPSPEWKKLKHYMHVIIKQHGKGIAELENIVTLEFENTIKNLEKNEGIGFNILRDIQHFSIRVILNLLVGKAYDSNDDDMDKIFLLVDAENQLRNLMNNALLMLFHFLRHFNFGIGSQVNTFLELKRKVIFNYFTTIQQIFKKHNMQQKGILFDLLKLQEKEEWLSDRKIMGAISDMFGAGILTTTASLYAFILILINNPDIQEKLQTEIDDVIGSSRSPQIQDFQCMNYTKAAILELLRYTSVVPIAVYSNDKESRISAFRIPSKSLVVNNLFRVHHDSLLWENPWQFSPDRFLDESGVLPACHPIRRNLIAFGVGKRACLGGVFAKTRIFLFITNLLQRYTVKSYIIQPPSCDPRNYQPGLIIIPRPYHIILEKRK